MNSKIENENIIVSISSHGAELMSIHNKKNNTEYLWQGDAKYWANRATLLFPFVGKLKDDTFFFEGSNYSVKQHGFARYGEFEILESSDSYVVYKFASSDETLKMYPFKFTMLAEYKIENNILHNNFTITNYDDKLMPFSLGGHPGFNCPLFGGEVFEDYFLEFDKPETQFTYKIEGGLFSKERVRILDNENILKLKSSLFDEDALIFENLNSKSITLKSKKSDSSVRVSVDGWKYVGVWTKAGGSPFICIEPWTGTADDVDSTGDITKKRGIIMLPPGEVYKNSFSIEII